MCLAEQVATEGVKGVHGLLGEVPSDAPYEGEEEGSADQWAELGRVQLHDVGGLPAHERVQQGAQGGHPAYLNLGCVGLDGLGGEEEEEEEEGGGIDHLPPLHIGIK